MEKLENHTITIHISYADEMTLFALEDSLRIVNEAFAVFSRENNIAMSQTNEISPKVKSISNGSLEVDVIVPVACALLPILYDIIKSKVNSNPKYVITMYSNSTRMLWTKDDNYKVCEEVLKEYVLGKSYKPVKDFLTGLSLSLPYSKRSIRAKLQNTKHLLGIAKIPNTVPVTPLPNFSEMHLEQFRKACENLNI